jgi:hypothetical protein
VYETLLFLHVLSAFMLVAGVVTISAMAVGASIGTTAVTIGNRLTEIGATGALVFGIWIALREDVYDITDGWILGAIVLWLVATALGTVAGRRITEGDDPRFERGAALLHWLGSAAVIGILVLMIWKPGV